MMAIDKKIPLRFIEACILLLCLWMCDACQRKTEVPEMQEETLPTNWNEVKGHTVAMITGGNADIHLSDNLPRETVIRVSNPVEVLAAVETGRAEYAAIDYLEVKNADLKQHGLRIIFESPEMKRESAFAFKLQDAALCQQYNDFFDSLCVSGRYREICERWSVLNLDSVRMPDIPQPEGDTIEVAAYSSGAPFTYIRNGQWYGWEIELLQLFGQHIGRPVHFNDYSSAALVTALLKGKVDIAAGHIFITEDRSRKALFSKVYLSSPEVCIGKDNRNPHNEVDYKSDFKKRVYLNLVEDNRWRLLVDGFRETLVISLWAMLLGSIFGALLCFFRMGKNPLGKMAVQGFIGFMRGVPMLVVLMFMFYVLLVDTGISATQVAIFAFTLGVGADLCEIFRGGIESVDKGQTKAGIALGLSKFTCFRKIVLPQAKKKILPQYKNEIVAVVKNTSIVGYIAIQDLTKMGDIIRTRTFDSFFSLVLISIIYLLIACVLNLVLKYILSEPNSKH